MAIVNLVTLIIVANPPNKNMIPVNCIKLCTHSTHPEIAITYCPHNYMCLPTTLTTNSVGVLCADLMGLHFTIMEEISYIVHNWPEMLELVQYNLVLLVQDSTK